jgi:hypothetical protein
LETKQFDSKGSVASSPYSLGKLIDWKLSTIPGLVWDKEAPYSLGKLIDWKLEK